MPIELTDAINRAELMSDGGLLPQQAYDLILQKLDDEDRHSFSMALVDRGIIVKTAEKVEETKNPFDSEKLAQQFVQQEDSPLWTPETWDNDDEWEELQDEDLEEINESELNLNVGESGYYAGDEGRDIQEIKAVLEENGISVDSEGKVDFYKSAIPGIYKDRLPQSMPLENAIEYFDQVLDMTDKEQNRMGGFLDLLSRLTSQTYDLEYSMDELEGYQFSPESRNEFTSGVASQLAELRGTIAEGNWDGSQSVLETLKGSVDQYVGEKDQHYEKNLSLANALDQLADMRELNPEKFQKVIEGVGGLPN